MVSNFFSTMGFSEYSSSFTAPGLSNLEKDVYHNFCQWAFSAARNVVAEAIYLARDLLSKCEEKGLDDLHLIFDGAWLYRGYTSKHGSS